MKNTLIAAGTIIFLSGLGYALVHHNSLKEKPALTCPTDTMLCPDGTEVKREGSLCEFSICRQKTPDYLKTEETATTSSSGRANFQADTSKEIPVQQPRPTTFFGKLKETVQTVFNEGTAFVAANVAAGISETSSGASVQATAQPNTKSVPSQQTGEAQSINETRYSATDSTIVSGSGTPIYSIPGGSSSYTSSSTENWDTHIVNVVPVATIKPVIGGVPVNGLPGKYYVSVNSFGNIEECEFSNRIYILDTQTDEMTLIYEENGNTLAKDDPRACSNEIYLLATDEEKLILKYHTINTNMVCESSWSEPEKTWSLDVTNLVSKTKRYPISNTLYEQAEKDEEECRFNLNENKSS